jgi:hypothetical protein
MERKHGTVICAAAATMAVLSIFPAAAAGPPSVTITSIRSGQTVASAQIPVTVAVSNFRVECADVGMPGTPGQGHIHAMVDGMSMDQLTNFYCSDSFNISGVGLKPGRHVLAVTLADDAHTDITKPTTVSFNYQPTSPQPLPGATTGGMPSVTIVHPQNGATVGKRFDLALQVKNFNLSCDLEGKPNVPGWGHVHVFVQQHGVTDVPMKKMGGAPMPMEKTSGTSMGQGMGEMHRGMMSMVGMISMPCTRTIPVDLSAWHSGNAHVLVMLVNNDHNPVMGAAPAAIDVTLK